MISIHDQRILFYDDSAMEMTEITKTVNIFDDSSTALSFDAGDYLYIGTYYPINHKYFEIITSNGLSSEIVPQIWDGRTWRNAIDVFDFTESSGITMADSGVVSFAADTSKWAWSFVNRTLDNPFFTEFSSLPDIYEKYWTRIGFSNPVTFTAKYIGDLFANENDLLSTYPQLNEAVLLNSWETGKTDWKKQRIDASEYIVNDLKRRNIILERSQIIELSKLVEPCTHYAAYMIFSGLGPRNYEKEIQTSKERYNDSMNQVKFEIDVSTNSRKDRAEMSVTVNRFTR